MTTGGHLDSAVSGFTSFNNDAFRSTTPPAQSFAGFDRISGGGNLPRAIGRIAGSDRLACERTTRADNRTVGGPIVDADDETTARRLPMRPSRVSGGRGAPISVRSSGGDATPTDRCLTVVIRY